eukprot:jgi/Tetstr1/439933/TSEL_028340.t1
MPDGEEPVAEPTLESLNADMTAQSSLLRELATTVAQLTARDRVVDGEGAHGSGSGQRFTGQPTGSGGAAERPDLLELAQSGRVGAKSVSAEDDYLAVPELLQRAESGYEAVRPVSRVPGLFPLSTDLTNEYLKQDDRRLPAQEEYLWMSCFGAHMAALFVALDELLPYVPAANQDFTPYFARARNHAEAIDKAFRFRLVFLRRLNEIKRVHAQRQPLLPEWQLQLRVAGVGEDVAAGVDVAAKDAFGSDELGQRTLDLLSSSLSAQTLKSYAGRLSQFAEFCHDSENISVAAKRSPLDDPLFAPPASGLSMTPDFYDIAADETSRILTEKRPWATLDQYRSLYRSGFHDDVVAHAALSEAAAVIQGAASHEDPNKHPKPKPKPAKIDE